MSATVQLLVVGSIVLLAAMTVFRRLAPGLAWRWQARLSFALERGPGVVARLGFMLRPKFTVQGGCASSCARCSGCG